MGEHRLLIAAVLALLAGPALFELGRLGRRTRHFLEGFVLVTVGGLFLFGILPAVIPAGGAATLAFTAAGFALPLIAETMFHRLAHRAHRVLLALGVVGLALHCVLDGIILLQGEVAAGALHDHSGEGHPESALAIILHDVPKGIGLWFLVAPTFGRRAALGVLLALVTATVAGYLGGGRLLAVMDSAAAAWFQAFVAGTVLHVLLHGIHAHDHAGPDSTGPVARWPERLGVLGGLLLLLLYR